MSWVISCGCAPRQARTALTSSAVTSPGLVAPRAADVGQHGGEIGVGQAAPIGGHGQIPILALDLERAVEARQGNVRETAVKPLAMTHSEPASGGA